MAATSQRDGLRRCDMHALLADFDELQLLNELADGRALRRLLDGPLHDPLARQSWKRHPTMRLHRLVERRNDISPRRHNDIDAEAAQ